MPIKSTPSDAPRLSPEEFDAVLASKGWTKKDVAARWGVTPVWVSNISRDKDRAPHWDDAVLGLPHHRFLSRNQKRRRNLAAAIASAAKQSSPSTGGFRYHCYLAIGSIVAATEDMGAHIEMGMRGIVFNVRSSAKQEEYGVIFESGEIDWFPPAYVDRLLVSTGLNDENATLPLSEDDALARFRSGLFDFN